MDRAGMKRATEGQDRENQMEGHSYRFYQNRKCEYFPCHEMEREKLNCLFCYCPLYQTRCPGEAHAVRVGDREVKDCSRCDFPHRPENFDTVVEHILAMLHARE